MYIGSFSVKLSDLFEDEPFDSGDGYIRCNCEYICKFSCSNCPCFTASKFCTESCTCHWCLNVPPRFRDLHPHAHLPPAKNRGRRGDSCSRFEDEGEDTYWKDWCRETEKSSPWKKHRESVGKTKTPLKSHRKKSKSESESESIKLEEPVRNLMKANKSKSKSSTSVKKEKKE